MTLFQRCCIYTGAIHDWGGREAEFDRLYIVAHPARIDSAVVTSAGKLL